MSLKQFIAHLKTLDFEVSLIQLQTSCCIDGVSKQELLGTSNVLAFTAKMTILYPVQILRQLTCS